MAKSSNQKFKILYLMKMLLERTDEDHPLTISQMITELGGYGIKAERKSIYDDIQALRHFGLDIVMVKGKNTGYFIGNRDFELPELKLLVDAVQCSKFVTDKKSRELITKLESLTSVHQADSLHRQVCLSKRPKNINESIYLNVDALHEAIFKKKKVSFKYFDYNMQKEKVFRKNGNNYTESPYALCWDDEYYYMITYSEKYGDFANYMVDRMSDITILAENRTPLPRGEEFDVVDYSKKVFSMFNGENYEIELEFHRSLINTVIDRFGKDVKIRETGEDSFRIREDVALSAPFYGWLFQFGNKVKIISPEYVIEEYKGYLRTALENYEQEK